MSANHKLELWKIVVLTVVLVAASFVIAYCVYSIYQSKNQKIEHQTFQQKMQRESDGTWGVIPKSACAVFEEAGLIGLNYNLVDISSNKYECSTPIVEIPSNLGKKTLQYRASGYPEKATSFNLVLSIEGDQDNKEAIAAKKAWAVYASVLYTKLFGNVVGQFSEAQMQQLAEITKDSQVNYYKDGKLLISANVVVKDGIGIYTFDIDGLPNLNVK